MGEKLVRAFTSELTKIADIDLRKSTEMLLENGHDTFLQWPASSSGKYHPPDEIGPMGMLIHAKRCVAIAPDIVRMYAMEKERLNQDILISACLVHDLYKQGKDGSYGHTTKDHMIIIYNVINDTVVDPEDKFKSKLANACLYHEGVWTPPEVEQLDNEMKFPSIYATMMHTVDMMVTRRAIYDVMQSDWVTRALTNAWKLINE